MSTTHLADCLVSSLSDCFPPRLGREAYSLIKRRLRSEGFFDSFHAEEVFSIALTNALKYLRTHGPSEIRNPEAWFHTLCRRACIAYLQNDAVKSQYTLLSVLDGHVELSAADTSLADDRILMVIRRAIQQLRPRLQQLIVLDLIECRPPAQIQKAMQIPSNGVFRKLKHEAFRGLREAVRAFIDEGGAGQFLVNFHMSDRELGDRIPERRTGLAVVAERAGRTPMAGKCHGVGHGISHKARAQAVPTQLARAVANQAGA
jgi:DNA-directed RNA polymerase specialized sigma24 family protein